MHNIISHNSIYITKAHPCNLDMQCALHKGSVVMYTVIIVQLLVIIKNNQRCTVHLLKQLNVN
jgi:hypothetical protein